MPFSAFGPFGRRNQTCGHYECLNDGADVPCLFSVTYAEWSAPNARPARGLAIRRSDGKRAIAVPSSVVSLFRAYVAACDRSFLYIYVSGTPTHRWMWRGSDVVRPHHLTGAMVY